MKSFLQIFITDNIDIEDREKKSLLQFSTKAILELTLNCVFLRPFLNSKPMDSCLRDRLESEWLRE